MSLLEDAQIKLKQLEDRLNQIEARSKPNVSIGPGADKPTEHGQQAFWFESDTSCWYSTASRTDTWHKATCVPVVPFLPCDATLGEILNYSDENWVYESVAGYSNTWLSQTVYSGTVTQTVTVDGSGIGFASVSYLPNISPFSFYIVDETFSWSATAGNWLIDPGCGNDFNASGSGSQSVGACVSGGFTVNVVLPDNIPGYSITVTANYHYRKISGCQSGS